MKACLWGTDTLEQRSADFSSPGQGVVCESISVVILQVIRKFLLLEETSWPQKIVMSVQTTASTPCPHLGAGLYLGLLEAKPTTGVR